MEQISIYCDESCHLEKDPNSNVMAFGCIWTPRSKVRVLSERIKEIKLAHKATGELKWGKVSDSRVKFYKSLIDWFVADRDVHFRTFVVADKSELDHGRFNDGSPDKFYYKCYYALLSKVLNPADRYDIYLDVKDTRSRDKVKELRQVLCNDKYSFTGEMIRQIRSIRSDESQLMQLCDFLLGAVTYRNRTGMKSKSKLAVIAHLENHLGRSLTSSTRLYEPKFNIFLWQPQRRNGK